MEWIYNNPGWTYLIWEVIAWAMLRISKYTMINYDYYRISTFDFCLMWLIPGVNMVFPPLIFFTFLGLWFYDKIPNYFWNKLNYILFGE
jgi:hypothetical protein